MEEWKMNCKNNAQKALKVAIFRLKIARPCPPPCLQILDPPLDPVSFYKSHTSLVHLFWAQSDNSVTDLVGRPRSRGSIEYEFLKIWMQLLLRQTKAKNWWWKWIKWTANFKDFVVCHISKSCSMPFWDYGLCGATMVPWATLRIWNTITIIVTSGQRIMTRGDIMGQMTFDGGQCNVTPTSVEHCSRLLQSRSRR